MPHSCVDHPSMRAAAACGQCGHLFCADCLVYPFGESRPPMCVGCALAAAGVRKKKSSRPKLRRSTAKARQATFTAETEQAAAAAAQETARLESEAAEAALQPTAEDLWLSDASDDLPGAWRQVF